MYIIKVKGKKKIPDYIQIRDENFMLIGYFSHKPGREVTFLDKIGMKGKETEFQEIIDNLPFGKLQKFEL